MKKSSKTVVRLKTAAKRKRKVWKRGPTPAAAAKRLGESLTRLAKDSLAVISGTIERRRRAKAAKKK